MRTSAGKTDLSKDSEDPRLADSDVESGDYSDERVSESSLRPRSSQSDTKNKDHATSMAAMKSIRSASFNQYVSADPGHAARR